MYFVENQFSIHFHIFSWFSPIIKKSWNNFKKKNDLLAPTTSNFLPISIIDVEDPSSPFTRNHVCSLKKKTHIIQKPIDSLLHLEFKMYYKLNI